MIALAFYKAPGTMADRVIRTVTRSAFSHVELVDLRTLRDAVGDRPIARCLSSSGRDGGVRAKEIELARERWDLVPAEWAPLGAIAAIERELGAGYDWRGLALSQLVALRMHSRRRWFCSEICGHALGLTNPHELSPGALRSRVLELTRVYNLGRSRLGGGARG